jgi:hypothetical protein
MKNTNHLVTFGDSWPAGFGLHPATEQPFGKNLADLLQIDNFVNCAIPGSSNDRTVIELLKYVNNHSSVKDHLAIFFITTPGRKLAIQQHNELIDINLNFDFANLDKVDRELTLDEIYYKHLHSTPQEQFDLERNILSLQRICSQLEIQDFYIVGWSDINLNCPGIDNKKIYKQNCIQILGYQTQSEYLANVPGQYFLQCGHPNFLGHQLIANALYNWIEKI